MDKSILLIIAGACTLAAQTGGEKEAALGRALAAEFSRSVNVIGNAEINRYVSDLAGELAPGSWMIQVIKENIGGATHEPAAFPGARLFIPAALILESRNEAEFAGMLAHGLAHVLNQDGSRLSAGGSIPLVLIGRWVGTDDRASTVPVGILPLARQFELDADARAAAIAAAAGFDPRSLVQYITRTQPQDRGRDQFSRLPAKSERLAALNKVIGGLPPVAGARSDRFDQIRRQVHGSLPSPRQKTPSLYQP